MMVLGRKYAWSPLGAGAVASATIASGPLVRAAAAWAVLPSLMALGQYSTPVGTGNARPKTLRATAVLEWTGSLEKPSASRLMPLAVWDGEHYQPASLYLAQPAPMALESGTQYVLERSGDPAGLFDVRGAAQLHGDWIGMGKYQPQPAIPAPPKLKVSKKTATIAGGKDVKPDTGAPTLHRKSGDSAPASSTPGSQKPDTNGSAGTSKNPDADTASSDPDRPTLHRRSDPGSSGSSSAGTDNADASAGTTSAESKAPDADPDRPTLHKHGGSDPSGSSADKPARADVADNDPDRPTLHRSRTASGSPATAAADPDRPHLRYGPVEQAVDAVQPAPFDGVPPTMQQIVAVSDAATSVDPHTYHYTWSDPGDAAKMQAALAGIAAQAAAARAPAANVAAPGSASGQSRQAAFGPASHVGTRRTRSAAAPAAPTLEDEHFAAYELSFSGGATLVYSAHTAATGSQRVYVTLIAQPDFAGKPQILLKQVTRGDRLDETPAMQLVDAVDTDDDKRAELVFQLNGGFTQGADAGAGTPSVSMAPQATRQFAIYRVADGTARQVFATGILP